MSTSTAVQDLATWSITLADDVLFQELDGDGVLRYCGQFRHGDRVAYVEDALKAVLAGKEPTVKTTPDHG